MNQQTMDNNTLKIGIGMPGITLEDVRSSARAAARYDFDSFVVFGDLWRFAALSRARP